MNERIKELAHQAGLPTYNPDGIPTKLEKFAELIVKECAGLVQGVPTDTMGYHTADQKIKEHFGLQHG